MYKIGFALILCSLVLLFSFNLKKQDVGITEAYQQTGDSLKIETFQILEDHCNACHQKKKPAYVFTVDNMNAFAPVINTQVFVKRKMPKGKKYPLSNPERQILQRWVNRQLNKE